MRAVARAMMGVAVLALTAGPMQAGTVLVSQSSGNLGYGYGFDRWDDFTAALNAATGNQVTVTADFSNLGQMLGFDALLLDQRWITGTLSATEINNLGTFIATGRRVLMMGENNSWAVWNSQILGIVGGSYAADFSGPTTALVNNELTHLAPTLDLPASGLANPPVGGTALYDRNFATLWGANGNVLTVLDINVWEDGNSGNNAQFGINVANWLAGDPVPEPTSLALVGIGVTALITLRVVRRRRAAKNFTSVV